MDGAANYTITETDLTMEEFLPFQVTVSCASGFESPAGVTPAVTQCAVQNMHYSVSGCAASPTVQFTCGTGGSSSAHPSTDGYNCE